MKNTVAGVHKYMETRLWGYYLILEGGDGFKIKRVVINPKEKLSLQMHYYRSEHWVVVKGMAEVTIGDKIVFVRKGESVYIPSCMKHRLANPGIIPLEVIEVEIGEYLKEDDVVRFDIDSIIFDESDVKIPMPIISKKEMDEAQLHPGKPLTSFEQEVVDVITGS
jgi:mannose-6-phosphate isomerase-like protein (cupin superfamily)